MRKRTLLICLLVMWTAPLQAQAPYYQGKTMTIVVGTVAGDLYDLYARAFGLFMGKYIPGNPNIIVQNMPGAGHMIAATYLYNVAKPDGLTMGAINAGLYFEQLIARSEVRFDWTKFTWIGNATKSPQVLYMRADSPYKTIEDVRSATIIHSQEPAGLGLRKDGPAGRLGRDWCAGGCCRSGRQRQQRQQRQRPDDLHR